MNTIIKSIKISILDLLFPKLCFRCGEVGRYVCNLCEKSQLRPKETQSCHVCKKEVFGNRLIHGYCRELTWLNGVVVGFEYNKFVEKLLLEFKYEGVFELKHILSKYLTHSIRSFYLLNKAGFVITTVPLHKRKKRKRGYDHLELLANLISKKGGVEYKALLEKKIRTKAQVGLKRDDRLGNIIGSFRIKNEEFRMRNARVVLLDDIMTTGSTLEECAKTLKAVGVKEVYGVVISRG
ncbi:MAG TPA: ComF family protein [bacterium]|nr:ComF family protein [bacterium]